MLDKIYFTTILFVKRGIAMVKKNKIATKTTGFSVAARNAEIKTINDRPCWAVRALRWLFIRMPRAVWNWICNIEIAGLSNLAMLLLIIVLFSILIGQTLGPRCDKRVNQATATRTPQITSTMPKDNVEIIDAKAINVAQPKQIIVPEKKTTIILPLKVRPKSLSFRKVSETTTITRIDGDVIIDGEMIGKRLSGQTKINGNLILQNMRGFTLPCGIKINGNLIIRNVRTLNFCGNFAVNGDIYVASDSSFGPLPRNARISGQIIF